MYHAACGSNWSRAVRIQQITLENRYDLTAREQKIALFSGVGRVPNLRVTIPNLLDKYEKLEKHDPMRHNLVKLLESILDEFVHGLASIRHVQKEWVIQRSIANIFKRMAAMGIASYKMYEQCLIQLTATERRTDQLGVLNLASYIYRLYKRSPEFNPSVALLQRLLFYWKSRRHLVASGNTGRTTEPLHIEVVISDYKRQHGRLDDRALFVLMETHAYLGDIASVRSFAQEYRNVHKEEGTTIEPSRLWPLIYVHAIRNDSVAAATQLARIKDDYGVAPDLRCWNTLMFAYQRVDDLVGALSTLDKLLSTNIRPDAFTFGPILSMYGKQGDIDSAKDMLSLAEDYGITPTTLMLNGLITASVNAGDMQGAERALADAMQAVKEGKAEGSLTICLNTMMTAHALRRDSEMTMNIYRYMKEKNMRLEGNTYAALLQALCVFRQTNAAYKILRSIMTVENVRPTAFHYAIIMAGYVNQGMYLEALQVQKDMDQKQIKPSISTRMAYFKAKALAEAAARDSSNMDGLGTVDPMPLQDTIDEMLQMLDKAEPIVRGKDPEPGTKHLSDRTENLAYMTSLIHMHGQRRCFEAVQELFNRYAISKEKSSFDEEAIPIRLLTAMMSAQLRAGEYGEVMRYWELAKVQADKQRQVPGPESSLSRKPKARNTEDPATFENQTLTSKPSQTASKAQRYILSRPLRYYLAALFAGSPPQMQEMTTTIASLLRDRYSLDNRTWNEYIVLLCRGNPPRALLAFTLVERYLIPDWPGWTRPNHTLTNATARPKAADHMSGMQYIRARYLAPGQLLPEYRTMVHLASALLSLQRQEAIGRTADAGEDRSVEAQVGTLKAIRERAPRTLQAVQSMPTVHDNLQRRLIRTGGEGE